MALGWWPEVTQDEVLILTRDIMSLQVIDTSDHDLLLTSSRGSAKSDLHLTSIRGQATESLSLSKDWQGRHEPK